MLYNIIYMSDVYKKDIVQKKRKIYKNLLIGVK